MTDDILSVVWFESLALRADLHRHLGVRRCDTVVAGARVRFGTRTGALASGPTLRVDGGCPCRDYVLDLVAEADRFLRERGATLHNPAGAVRTHLRTRGAGDWIRAFRVARGAQARTDRIRGSSRAAELPTDFDRAVLEYLVDEAGSPAPLDGQGQLLARLCERAAREFGGLPEGHRPAVVDALPRIEAVCRAGRRSRVDGVELTWWERYIEIPLGRRDRWAPQALDDVREWAAEVPCPAAEAALASTVDVLAHGPGGSDGAVLALVLDAVASEAPEQALARTLADLVRREVVPRSAAALVADADRMGEVVAAARAVLPAPRG